MTKRDQITFHGAATRLLAGIGLAALMATSAGASATTVAEAPSSTAEVTHLTGFRSATFGMTEDQVRGAITKDFNLSGKDVGKSENPTEKTTILDVTVKNLLPSGGDARVSYIFGYQSHKLIQVNVGWGAMGGTTATLESLVEAANQLRTYLLGVGYRADSIVANARLPDGTILVFRGLDADNRGATVVLTGIPADKSADAKGDAKDKAPPVKPASLQLSYVSDPKNPDVFHIKPGQF